MPSSRLSERSFVIDLSSALTTLVVEVGRIRAPLPYCLTLMRTVSQFQLLSTGTRLLALGWTPSLVQNARAEEIQWMQSHGQWEVVPIYEAKAVGQRLIGTRFVDVNKGDLEHPDVRSRLVAQDTRYASSIQGNSSVETFAATPPLEGLRLLFALHMTHSPSLESCVLSFLDIKKAHLLPFIDRDVFL